MNLLSQSPRCTAVLSKKSARRYKVSKIAKCVGSVLLLCGALAGTVQAQSSVTLAWNPVTNSPVTGYRLYRGTTSHAYIANTNAGCSTQATLTGLIAGVTNYFAVTAYNASGVESDYSTEVAYVIVVTNTSPPVITLSGPVNGSTYTAPATISLSAAVTPNSHVVSKVQFYANGSLVGEDASSPYTLSWSNVAAGTYSLTARLVYDTTNQLNSVNPVTVSVDAARPPGSLSFAATAGTISGAFL